MCRIAGFIDFHGDPGYDLAGTVRRMRDTMAHGGPDDAGEYLDAGAGVAFGHRRLSIIDLSPAGHQPMTRDGLVITFNGEIYNYAEVRAELEKADERFTSGSDTEVVLKAYRLWGADAFAKFRGMWAMAIWNEREKRLLLCRDRAGVKPLYWYNRDGLFMFSSELKAFHEHPKFSKRIDQSALALYLRYGYIAAPKTIFEYTHKLEPGSYLTIDANRSFRVKKYWNAADAYLSGRDEFERRGAVSDGEVEEELEALLRESFRLRMVSDVPVGMFLSGGVDSSLLTAILAKDGGAPLKTFTIGFREPEYDEAGWAAKVARHLGTDHTELYCTAADAFAVIPKLPEIYDEPMGDASGIPTYLVSKLARTKVKVSLSADGGDEQFCGYDRYPLAHGRIARLCNNPLSGAITKGLRIVKPELAHEIYDMFRVLTLDKLLPKWHNFRDKYAKLRGAVRIKDPVRQYDYANNYFTPEDIAALGLHPRSDQTFRYDAALDSLDEMTRMMYLDINTYLPDDVLVKVDRASMAVALEGRDPFLDHKIMEYSAALPLGYKYRDGVKKYILKKILYKYVPREIVDRPKQGFGVPVHEWFKGELAPMYREYLDPARIGREGIFDAAAVGKLVDDYFAGRGVNAYKLWFLFAFELWHERYMKK